MSWRWCSSEDEALDYLPHAAQVLYLRVLRRRMDFRTGIVGLSVRISYQMIGEWLEVRPVERSTKPIVRLTVAQIRSALEQLERAGLIERVKDRDGKLLPLVFFMPLAETGLVRQKYEQQDEQQQNPLRATAIYGADNKITSESFIADKSVVCDVVLPVDNRTPMARKKGMSNSKKRDEQQDEQQTTGMSVSRVFNNNIYLLRARNNETLVAEGWVPGDFIVNKLIDDFCLPRKFIYLKAVELRLLWREQGRLAADWDGYFYGACRNQVERGSDDFLRAINNNPEVGDGGK